MRVITYGDSNVSLLSSFFELSKIDNPNTTINDDDKFTSTLENKKVYYINNSQFQLRVKVRESLVSKFIIYTIIGV
jgi:hypothetical protein